MTGLKRVLAPAGYEILDLLSRNHDYDVHQVYSVERDCLCIAKSLQAARAGHARARARLLTEGRLLRTLDHPHLVKAYDVLTGPRPVVILEVLPGATLSHLITELPRGLGTADLCRLGAQLASVLGYLHRNGILHLDLKPSNLVVSGGLLTLLDLAMSQAPGPVRAGEGTAEYLAPEQARGRTATAATDVWGVGGVLYRAATRRRPFPDAADDHYPQVTRAVAPVRRYRRNLPPKLTDLIQQCLDPEPSARPTLTELKTTLASLV